MDPRTIEVEHRLDELRRTAAALRAERETTPGLPTPGPVTELRLAVGRRLVAVGTALQRDTAATTRSSRA